MIRSYLQLLRAPLAATAVSNAWVGGALAGGEAPLGAWALVGLASVALYWAGMVLNDVFDRERDAHLFPKRPLPSGRISVAAAATLGAGLLLGGVGLAAGAGALAGRPLWGLGAGAAVALAILGYDGLLKRWRHPGALVMGSCRALNAGLGVVVLGGDLGSPLGWGYAAFLGLYVYALTVFSTWEDEDAPRLSLITNGGLLLALPVAAGAWCMHAGGSEPPRSVGVFGCALLLVVVWSQLVELFVHGTKAKGQATTRNLLHALWAVDLGAALLGAPWLLLVPCGVLYVGSRAAIKALFRPPPAPAPAPVSDSD